MRIRFLCPETLVAWTRLPPRTPAWTAATVPECLTITGLVQMARFELVPQHPFDVSVERRSYAAAAVLRKNGEICDVAAVGAQSGVRDLVRTGEHTETFAVSVSDATDHIRCPSRSHTDQITVKVGPVRFFGVNGFWHQAEHHMVGLRTIYAESMPAGSRDAAREAKQR